MICTNAELYTRIIPIYNVKNFDKRLQPIAAFIAEHVQKYSSIPTPEQILATTGIEVNQLDDMNDGHCDFFLEEFEKFTKRQELERAILKSAELMEKGDFDPVEKIIKDAVQISLQRDMGTDYFADPKGRLTKYFNQGGQVSTGWPQLDSVMYGGCSRGELMILAGSSGSGKSLVMMNMALNWLSMGLSGVYITLELSEELTSLRTDAMLTSMSTREIRKHIEDTELKVKMASKKYGKYRVKGMPAQSNVNAIRSYLKEVQIQTGIKVDFVMVDYLDLLTPAGAKVNASDLFVKDKYVSEELRNLSQELGILLVTASQLNRSAVDEPEFDHSHIAGGISKINSADYVFGIFTSRSMRERGKYQMQCMKARNSTGVGAKIELDYDIETMRITDNGIDAKATPQANSAQSLLAQVKRTPVPEASAPAVDVQGTKLKNLLRNLKTQNGED